MLAMGARMRRGSVLLLLVGGCDDTAFAPVGGCPAGTYTADWTGVQALMDDHCASCHAGGSSAVVLPDDVATDITDGTGFYVVPGDAAASKLWRVIAGDLGPTDLSGVMPLGTGPLDATCIAHVKTWIDNGADLGAADTSGS